MSAPSVEQRRVDGQTGAGPQFADGVIAILAPAEKGTADKLYSVSDWTQVFATFGGGILSETAAYVGPRVRRPMIVGRVTPSVDGTYSDISVTNPAGVTPSAPTAGTSKPWDDFSIVIRFLAAGTVGNAGIRYQTSKDGGVTFARALALGTATSINVPGTGASVNLGTGGVIVGTTWTFKTTAPAATAADFAELEKKLKATSLDFEAVLKVFPANATAITAGEALLTDWESKKKYVIGLLNVRPMDLTAEDEADYLGELQGIYDTAGTSIRQAVGADGAYDVSLITKQRRFYPASVVAAAKTFGLPLGTDPAEVDLGPTTANIRDADGNAIAWDEETTPGLDDLRFSTLRTFPGRSGSFVTNVNMFSPVGSDYVWIQHARCMNRALKVGNFALTQCLSRKLRPDPELGPNGEMYVAQGDINEIQSEVTRQIRAALDGQVAGVQFIVPNRVVIPGNGPTTVTGNVELLPFAYLKKIVANYLFVRALTAST
ncbi:MAG: hypothetical protein KF764_02995 [Labilithrix sp.]|nr:hypothetical protein [Labilithrix sp.]